jgi:hypothetical protein
MTHGKQGWKRLKPIFDIIFKIKVRDRNETIFNLGQDQKTAERAEHQYR